MSQLSPEMQFIKSKMKEVWSNGDFGVVAKILSDEAENFINRLNIKQGSKVLDVACGNGNSALPAARRNASVTGLDIVPDLILQAKSRAKAENLNIRFEVGDAESMPFGDNEFDYVNTMFGVMFCPRPDVALSEMLRVCKPGGIIAMANWTPEGNVGKMFRLSSKYAPPPPGLPAPLEWGTEEVVRKRFGSSASNINFNRYMCRQNLDMPANEAVEHFINYFGPTKTLYEMLDDSRRPEFKNEFRKLWVDNNISSNDKIIIDSEYLEVIAEKKK